MNGINRIKLARPTPAKSSSPDIRHLNIRHSFVLGHFVLRHYPTLGQNAALGQFATRQ
jgi:hypothetical protein